jgi:A/G-specific adenine glycosylase
MEALFAWYERHGRDFPWRHTDDPWAILVSEVMSQQTQIERVAARYNSFLTRFPTPRAMASAAPADVLTEWSGLGYNRRALNLQAAARVVAESGWPDTTTGLGALPGVGPYTAAAVACFAFGKQLPAIDTNLKRVLSRWVGRALTGSELSEQAVAMVPYGQAAQWNSAVMDLGALICKPVPRCDACPVSNSCVDPTVYIPPPRQAGFDGSLRQTRGAIVKLMIDGRPRTADLVARTVRHEPDRVETALTALVREGVLESADSAYVVVGAGAVDPGGYG